MYSHDLQTCDWPRNVGCDPTSEQQTVTVRDIGSRDTDAFQVVTNKFRFSSLPAQQTKSEQLSETGVRQSQYRVQQTLPPPPELRIAPNPVITSRGQPKPFEPSDLAKVSKVARPKSTRIAINQ